MPNATRIRLGAVAAAVLAVCVGAIPAGAAPAQVTLVLNGSHPADQPRRREVQHIRDVAVVVGLEPRVKRKAQEGVEAFAARDLPPVFHRRLESSKIVAIWVGSNVPKDRAD